MKLSVALVILFFTASLQVAGHTFHSLCEHYFADASQKEFAAWNFDFICQVLLVCDGTPRRICPVNKGHPYTSNFLVLDSDARCQSGDIVRLIGHHRLCTPDNRREESSQQYYACITNLTVIGNSPWPQTTQVTAKDIDVTGALGQFIHVDGIVSSAFRDTTNAGWNWLTLRTPTGSVRAAVTEHDYPLATLLPLIDAEVRLKGITHEFGAWRKFLGFHVFPFGKDGIVTLQPAPSPFDAPPLKDHRILHRQQVRGQICGSGIDQVFIRDKDNKFLLVRPQDGTARPPVGSTATISGFVTSAPMGYQLTEAVLRAEADPIRPPPAAEPIDTERMFATQQGNEIVDAALYGKLIRLRGMVANSQDSIRTDGKIHLECGQRAITVDMRHLTKHLADIPARGCIIDVSGICLSDFDADVTNLTFPRFKGFVIVPRTAGDIVIVKRPPWWTVGKLLCVIAVLALGLVVILIWNRMLKVLSERRGRELYKEQIESARSDLKVEERTRLAIELHDSISQTLTGVALQIDAATKTGKANPSAAERFLGTARTMLASCRQELRCCIWDLKSRTFDEKDMTEAVQKTLAPHVGDTELHVRFNVPRSILSESATHDTLRIVRELAVNALRHGQARHLRVAGEYKDGYVRFSVQDDGKGFDPATLPGPADGHFGLQGIRERVKNRNGELHIESAVGTGTKVTVTLLADEKDEDEK